MAKRSHFHSSEPFYYSHSKILKTNTTTINQQQQHHDSLNKQQKKPFKIPDGKVLVNKKLLWTYEMDKKLLDLYEKNGAHWLLISTVMENSVGCGDNYFNTISVKQRVEYLLTQLNKNCNDEKKKKELKEPDFYSYLYETSKFNGISTKFKHSSNNIKTENKENLSSKLPPPSLAAPRKSIQFRIESSNSSLKPVRLIDSKDGIRQIMTSRPVIVNTTTHEESNNSRSLIMSDENSSRGMLNFNNSTGSSSPLDYDHQQQNELIDFDYELEKRLSRNENDLFPEPLATQASAAPVKVEPLTSIAVATRLASNTALPLVQPLKSAEDEKDMISLPKVFPICPKETKDFKFRRILQVFADENWQDYVYPQENILDIYESSRKLIEDMNSLTIDDIAPVASVFF